MAQFSPIRRWLSNAFANLDFFTEFQNPVPPGISSQCHKGTSEKLCSFLSMPLPTPFSLSLSFFFVLLGIKFRTLGILGKHSTTPSPLFLLFILTAIITSTSHQDNCICLLARLPHYTFNSFSILQPESSFQWVNFITFYPTLCLKPVSDFPLLLNKDKTSVLASPWLCSKPCLYHT